MIEPIISANPAMLAVDANGGSVAIERLNGDDEWVVIESYDADTTTQIAVAGARGQSHGCHPRVTRHHRRGTQLRSPYGYGYPYAHVILLYKYYR